MVSGLRETGLKQRLREDVKNNLLRVRGGQVQPPIRLLIQRKGVFFSFSFYLKRFFNVLFG